MKKNGLSILTTVLLVVLLSLLLGPRLLYRPIATSSERVFLFEGRIHNDGSSYEALGASALLKLYETDTHEIIEVQFFDDIVIHQINQDFTDFRGLFNTVNYKVPWDIKIIEHDDNLEIIIHARYEDNLFYQQKRVFVSKYFNMFIPFLGGIRYTDLGSLLKISFLAGLISGVLAETQYTSYDDPIVFYIVITKSANDWRNKAINMQDIKYPFDALSDQNAVELISYVIILE